MMSCCNRLREHRCDRMGAVTKAAVPIGNTYDKYGSANPIERRLMAGFMRRLEGLLPLTGVTRILEVGVGEGHIAARVRERYPEAEITGIDLPDSTLAGHWKAKQLVGAFASAERLPFADDAFDLLLAVEVLEHVPNPDKVLAEMARVARHSAILTVPWEPWWRVANVARGKYLAHLGNTPGHVQHWGRAAFADVVKRHFTVTACRGSFPWTLVAAQS